MHLTAFACAHREVPAGGVGSAGIARAVLRLVITQRIVGYDLLGDEGFSSRGFIRSGGSFACGEPSLLACSRADEASPLSSCPSAAAACSSVPDAPLGGDRGGGSCSSPSKYKKHRESSAKTRPRFLIRIPESCFQLKTHHQMLQDG